MSEYEWQDEYLVEKGSSIIESLGRFGDDHMDGEKVVEISKTEKGYRFVEQCDGYHGCTLTQEQMERFIGELQTLAGITEKPVR